MSNNSVRVGFDTERSVAAPFTGAAQNLGTPLAHCPAIMIFDNQSDVSVVVSANGIAWKTFPAGEALVLDLSANHALAANYTVDAHTQFSIVGTAGTGSFNMSILYRVGT